MIGKLSISARIFVILFVSGFLLAASSTYIYAIKAYEYQRSELSIKIATASVRLTRAIIKPASQNDLSAVKNIVSAFAGTPEVVCVELNLRRGNFSEVWPNEGCLAEDRKLMVHDQPIRRGTKILGNAKVYFTDDFINENIRVFVQFVAFGVTAVLGILLAVLLISQKLIISMPINRIISSMSTFKVGDSFTRSVSKASPEFLKISAALHQLMSTINKQATVIIDKNQMLEAQNLKIEEDRRKLELLVENILPSTTISELREKGTVTPKKFENVGILFLDFVGFTEQSAKTDAALLFFELNEMFTCFDIIAEKYGCERIKTIGDAYLAVTNVNFTNSAQNENLAKMAIEIIELITLRNDKIDWKCRIGLHVGDLVAGVVGKTKISFDVFGDGINTASRVEGASEALKINCSEDFYQTSAFKDYFENRGLIEIKGKKPQNMYFLSSDFFSPDIADLRVTIEASKRVSSLLEEAM